MQNCTVNKHGGGELLMLWACLKSRQIKIRSSQNIVCIPSVNLTGKKCMTDIGSPGVFPYKQNGTQVAIYLEAQSQIDSIPSTNM